MYDTCNCLWQCLSSFQNGILTLESYMNGSWTQVGTWSASNKFQWTSKKIPMKLDFERKVTLKVATLDVSTHSLLLVHFKVYDLSNPD